METLWVWGAVPPVQCATARLHAGLFSHHSGRGGTRRSVGADQRVAVVTDVDHPGHPTGLLVGCAPALVGSLVTGDDLGQPVLALGPPWGVGLLYEVSTTTGPGQGARTGGCVPLHGTVFGPLVLDAADREP